LRRERLTDALLYVYFQAESTAYRLGL